MEATNTNARLLSITTPNPGNHDRIALTSASPRRNSLTLIGSSAKSGFPNEDPIIVEQSLVIETQCQKDAGWKPALRRIGQDHPLL